MRGRTLLDLSIATHLNQSVIWKTEVGKQLPNLRTLTALARELQVSIDYIVHGERRSNHRLRTDVERVGGRRAWFESQ